MRHPLDIVAMFAALWLLASMVLDALTPKELTAIMIAVNSFGVSASSTIDASSQSAANMATMSSGCRNPMPLAGCVIVVAGTPAVKSKCAYSSSLPGVGRSMKWPKAVAIGLAASSCQARASKATIRRPCFTIETLANVSRARPERR